MPPPILTKHRMETLKSTLTANVPTLGGTVASKKGLFLSYDAVTQCFFPFYLNDSQYVWYPPESWCSRLFRLLNWILKMWNILLSDSLTSKLNFSTHIYKIETTLPWNVLGKSATHSNGPLVVTPAPNPPHLDLHLILTTWWLCWLLETS